MRRAKTTAAILLLSTCGLIATPALAQVAVTVENPSFQWTGKSGQQANYRWSATIDNPSGRDLTIRVTLELLDSAGAVVASDSAELGVPKRDRSDVERDASVAFSDAQRATHYRIVLAEIRR